MRVQVTSIGTTNTRRGDDTMYNVNIYLGYGNTGLGSLHCHGYNANTGDTDAYKSGVQ